MNLDSTIEFEGLTVRKKEVLFRHGRCINNIPWPKHWTRVQITLPRQREAYRQVINWIEENLQDLYGATYVIGDEDVGTKTDRNRIRAVFAFANSNDALMFKLQGGHKAYEEEE